MRYNDQLKAVLQKKLTDDEIYHKAYEDFSLTTHHVLTELKESTSSRNTYKFNPIFRISYTSDLFLKKELLKRFTDTVEEFGYRHENNPPQNAYCIYINLK